MAVSRDNEVYWEKQAERQLAAILRQPPKRQPINDRMLSAPEVWRMLGISRSTFERRLAAGRFPPATNKLPPELGRGQFGWLQQERRWPGGLVRAIVYGILPSFTLQFSSAEEWREYINQHYG